MVAAGSAHEKTRFELFDGRNGATAGALSEKATPDRALFGIGRLGWGTFR
jgi:hypothetical protein